MGEAHILRVSTHSNKKIEVVGVPKCISSGLCLHYCMFLLVGGLKGPNFHTTHVQHTHNTQCVLLGQHCCHLTEHT